MAEPAAGRRKYASVRSFFVLAFCFSAFGVVAAQPEPAPKQPVAPIAKDVPAKEAIPAAVDPEERQKVELVKDDPAFKEIADKKPIPEPLENPEEFKAYERVMLQTRAFSSEVQNKYARLSVSYSSLIDEKERQHFLRDLLHLKGKLTRLFSTPNIPTKLKASGAEFLYTGWFLIDGIPDQPIFLYFTDLPKGVRQGINLNYRIEAVGYYFKLMEYEVEKDVGVIVKEKHYAPLILARTIKVLEELEPTITLPGESEESRVRLNRKDPLWLSVADETPLVKKRDDNPDEFGLYDVVMQHAFKFPQETLNKYSRKDAVFADLLGDNREEFLRELIHVEGTLIRLREREAIDRLKVAISIKKIYDGWIELPIGNNPDPKLINIAFTELPNGLVPAEKMNVRVGFDGYYFKLTKYEAESNKAGEKTYRRAPLLIGHTIEILPSEESVWKNTQEIVPAIMGVIAIVVVGVVIIAIWLRRGDRRVKANAHDAMTRSNPFKPAVDPEVDPSAVEPGAGWNRINIPPPN